MPKKTARQITGLNELFELANSENIDLVREIAIRWNTVEPEIYLLYGKLVSLGFTCRAGEIVIVEQKEVQDYASLNTSRTD